MGSVKDLELLKKPENGQTGLGNFIFSDRYSVFDWGEMPDHILHKGQALCIMSAYFFERLEAMGIKTHYLGVVEKGQLKRLAKVQEPVNTLQVKLLRVVRPELNGNMFDYSIFQKEHSNFLIPLEVIYRNALPEGASVFKRLKEGSLKLKDIGLDEMPSPGQVLERPIVDVSTKLETIDRYISWDEAQKISGLSKEELEKIKRMVLVINGLITNEVERVGLINEDGKFEFGFDEKRSLVLLDVLGTPDECRFTFEGLPVSKEVARIYYRNTPWFKDVEEAKKKDKIRWKALVNSKPSPLPARLSELISQLYQACCNEITQRKWFQAPPLKEILSGIKGTLHL
jgi:phosphoribosylaminoimidazole-succinocarboxamide synthase